MLLSKLFKRKNDTWLDAKRTDYQGFLDQSVKSEEPLPAEYGKLVGATLMRWGISEGCASLEIKSVGEAADGRQTFVALIRVLAWEEQAGLRLLIGLPLLEKKIRKEIRAHWIGEVSDFGGLWLHASENLADAAAHEKLHKLLVSLEEPKFQGRKPKRESSDPTDPPAL